MQNRKGFTLIELLIVVVIIGILAAIAIPKFANTKEKAYIAAMKSDLRNLVTAQEAYFADHDNVYATQAEIEGAGFTLSTGVTFSSVTPVAGTGWGAQVQHNATTVVCGIAVGDGVNPVDGTANEGEPVCPIVAAP